MRNSGVPFQLADAGSEEVYLGELSEVREEVGDGVESLQSKAQYSTGRETLAEEADAGSGTMSRATCKTLAFGPLSTRNTESLSLALYR